MPKRGRRMALQAKQVHVAVLQHVRIRATVRDMARCASFHLYAGVREHERPLLVSVALEAAVVAGIGSAHLPNLVIRLPVASGSVLVVAIGAFNQAIVHAVPKWHVELRPLLQMASVAKFGLVLD